MLKNILFILLISLLSGKTINKVIMSVNGEAITFLEFNSLMDKFNLDKKAAIEILIKDRLEKKFIKQVNISITSFNLEESIRRIENSQNLTREQLKLLIQQKGITWSNYKKYLSQDIKKNIFLKEYVFKNIKQPTELELKTYYKENINSFKYSSKMDIIAYASPSLNLLNIFLTNPMKQVDGVAVKYISIKEEDINPNIYKILEETKAGDFTRIIQVQGHFTMYYMQNKGTKKISNFTSMKSKIHNIIIKKYEKEAEKKFFNKLKSNAIIKII